MARFALGIDSGSSFFKGALLRFESGAGGGGVNITVKKLVSVPAGWDIEKSAADVRAALLAGLPPGAGENGAALFATGYGRSLVKGAARTISEIKAHARGADFLFGGGVRAVIDIGGQDCKIISVGGGRVVNFIMNDKCAAGSGRFLEAVCRRLDVQPALMDEFLSRGKKIPLNSTCVVFAESEIISLLSGGAAREEILGGAADALSRRIASLAARLPLASPAVLSGGFAASVCIAAALSSALGLTVLPLENGAFAGAVGAALEAVSGEQAE